MLDQRPRRTQQTAVPADHNRQIHHGADLVAGLHFPLFKVGQGRQAILDRDLQPAVIKQIEEAGHDFLDAGVLTAPEQAHMIKSHGHHQGA